MKQKASKNKGGRPRRKEKTEKLNLLVSVKSKRRAFAMASERDISQSKLFENLVAAEEARCAQQEVAA